MPPAYVHAYLRNVVPSWGQEYIEGTLFGDPTAARDLSMALRDHQRAEVTAYLVGLIEPRAFRELMLGAVMQTNYYGEMRRLAGSRKRFSEWCRFAEFELPDLPKRATVFRGSRNVAPAWSARQLSWSPDFDCAAFFAVGYRGPATGYVLEATVLSSKIVFYDDERREKEVIFEATPRRFKLHEDQAILRAAADRYQAVNRYKLPDERAAS